MYPMIYQRLAKRLLLWAALCLLLIGGTQCIVPLQAAPPTTQLTHKASTTGIPIFGFETNINRLNNSQVRTRAEELGGSWVRLNTISWRDLQPTEDTPVEDWNWDAASVFEQELITAQELGLTPLVIADDFPDWAVKPYTVPGTSDQVTVPCAALKTDYFDDYSVYLRELVERYSVAPYHVQYWEIGNEVDVDPRLMSRDLQDLFGCWGEIEDPYYGGEHYGNMLKVIAPVIRQADPQAKIVIGGLLLDRAETNIQGRGKPEKFFEGVLKAGAADSFDIVGYHAYPWYSWEQGRKEDVDLTDYRWSQWGGMTLGKAKYLRSLMDQYNVTNKPLFLDEAALLYWGGSPTDEFEQTQADHLVRVIVRALAIDVEMFSWYTLHKSGWNSSGLLNSDYSPRPSFIAYKTLVQQMATADDPAATDAYGSALEAYRFTRQDGKTLDVVWSRDGTTDYITLPASAFVEAKTRDGEPLTVERTETRVVVPVWVAPVYIVQQESPTTTTPTLSAVKPETLLNTANDKLTLSGESFVSGARVWLEQITAEKTQSIELESVVYRNPTLIEATVPAMLPPGSYDVVVQNPNGAIDVLANGFTITANVPDITGIHPQQGRVDRASQLYLTGKNFMADSTVRLGEWEIPSDAVTYMSPEQLHLTLPATPTLAAGSYPVTVGNPDTTSDTVNDGFRVIGPDEVDLYGYAYQLWTEPRTPRVEQPMQMGLVVYRLGTANANDAVDVTFYRESTSADNVIGATSVNLPTQPGTVQTSEIAWTTTISGESRLCALIDKNEVVPEDNESNNRLCRDIQILPPAFDHEAPRIQAFTINGDEEPTIASPDVMLEVQATDVVSGSLLANGTGIAGLIFQEYMYSNGNAQWVPVQHSEWITDTMLSSHAWRVLPTPGKKYLQVWAVDDAGNISAPATASVVYTASGDSGESGEGEPGDKTMPPLLLPSALLPEGMTVEEIYLPLVLRME